jgi:hypothetical protein
MYASKSLADTVRQLVMTREFTGGVLASLVAAFLFAAWQGWIRRVLVALLRWINSLMQEASAESTKPSNNLPVRGRVRPIGVSSEGKRPVWVPYNFGQVVFTAFVGEFTNQALEKHQVFGAERVRAKISLTLHDLPDRSVNSDPAPWLIATFPTISFGVGETHEVILGVLNHSVQQQSGKFKSDGVQGIRDHRDQTNLPDQFFDWGGTMVGRRILATVMLTVDGYSKGPFRFGLDLGDPANREKSPPMCLLLLPLSRSVKLRAKLKGLLRRFASERSPLI